MGWTPKTSRPQQRSGGTLAVGGVHGGLYARGQFKLAQDGLHMDFYRRLGNVERAGNFLVAAAQRDLAQYFFFAWGQQWPTTWCCRPWGHARRIWVLKWVERPR